jgi:23S rRNA pseudouridine1911/1915/1917 synthase
MTTNELKLIEVLFEDNHLIAVNKNNSDLVQGDITGDEPLLEKVRSFLKESHQKPGNVFIGLPHRLDRPVSGVVIFAKTSKSLVRLNAMFHDKEVEKIYWAAVKNPPPEPEGTLSHHLVRNHTKNKSYAFDEPRKDSKPAKLIYKTIARSDHYYLLEIQLITGRHHQIRAQMTKIGCPIKGDLKYGFPRSNPDAGIHLHARRISFLHPVTKKQITIIAEPPDDPIWKAMMAQLPADNIDN